METKIEKITCKRLLRWTLASIIVLITIAYAFGVGIASAESGTISFVSDFFTTGSVFKSVAGQADSAPNLETLRFMSSTYDRISEIYIFKWNDIALINPISESDVSDFTIISGGTGYGVVSYSRSLKYLKYVFSTSTIITSNYIVLNFTKPTFKTNISFYATRSYSDTYCGTITVPVCVLSQNGNPWVDDTTVGELVAYTSTVGQSTYLDYLVTYPMSNYFQINITKYIPSSDTKTIIHSSTTNIQSESTFNDVSYSFFGSYLDGLYLNVTTLTGTYRDVLINSTGISDAPSISDYSYNISFNKSFYSLNDLVNFSYHITDNSTTTNIYYIRTYQTEKSSGNYYTNAYQVNPDIIGYYDSSGYIVPLVYTNMISDFDACIMQNNIEVYCKSVGYGYAPNLNTSITGNISLNKNSYNLSEIVQMTYNMTMNGRIIITQGFDTIFNQDINSGTNLKLNYTVNSIDIGLSYVRLQYLLNGSWITLDTKTYSTKDVIGAYSNIVYFNIENINLGQTMIINHIQNQSIYLVLKDSENIIKFNYSYGSSSGFLVKDYYNLLQTDKTGIWIVYLYDVFGNVLSSDEINVEFDIVIEPTVPTPITTLTQEEKGLIDIGNQIGIMILGNVDKDNSGDYSDSEIIKTGNSIFLSLFVIALFLLIGGSYKYLKR